MNTAGKSDIFEAILQLLILSALQEHGPVKAAWLTRNLHRRISGVACIEERSLHIALTKLEISGWIKRGISASTARHSEKWELTKSASECLPRELKQWKIFIDNWPLIAGVIQAAVQTGTPGLCLPA